MVEKWKRFINFLRRVFWRHHWVYRNPYDRTRSTCGRREVSMCWTLETWNRGWWETYNDGDECKHYKSIPIYVYTPEEHAEAEKLRELLKRCRPSVATDLMQYEQLAGTSRTATSATMVYQQTQKLHELLIAIDRVKP